MNASLFIAKRYLFSKSKSRAINIITIIAATGIVIASASLVIVLSGFAGLKDFTLQFSTFTDPDLKVFPEKGKSIVLSSEDLTSLNAIDGVKSYSLVIEERVVIKYQEKNEIVTLKGVDQNYPKATVDSILVQGNWMIPGENQLVSGWGVTNVLGYSVLQISDKIKVYVPKPGIGQLTSLKSAYNVIEAINIGVFQINEELDANYVFTSYETAQRLLGFKTNEVTSIELITDAEADTEDIRTEILSTLQNTTVKNRFQLNDALYKMLNTENLAVYLIFTLVLIIALFNVIGSIIMMILDKRKDLKTLIHIGFTTKQAKQIFFFQGFLMTLIGGVIGVILGVLLVILQWYFGWFKITPSLPYPVTLKFFNILITLATILVLGLIASRIASRRINTKLISTSA